MITDLERLALVLRTLRIDEAQWRRLEEQFAADFVAGNESLDQRLQLLKNIWNASAHENPVSVSPDHDSICAVCKEPVVEIAAARNSVTNTPLVYGECRACGHGVLLHGGAKSSIYSQPDYYRRQDSSSAGYESYLMERGYRESKGQKLLEWIIERAGRPIKTYLEVGSGFGFTRAAAELLGLKTAGVDVNPEAAKIAGNLYSQQTFIGTLTEAIDSRGIAIGFYDIVCYQFVLEHLDDPAGELLLAARILSPRGVLVLVVPNMQADERKIFGAYYRSFRPDHLWLFSPESIRLMLEEAGLRIVSIDSECNIRLLDGFLSKSELIEMDADCRSADLRIIAEKI